MWKNFIGKTIQSIETREVRFYESNYQTLARFTFTDGTQEVFKTDCGDLEDCFGNLQSCPSFDDLSKIEAEAFDGEIKTTR